MAETLIGINFKSEPELKEAIRRAAFHGGYKNSSELIIKVISSNKLVKTELDKIAAEAGKSKKKSP